jgi:hypothetical protein
MRSERVIGLKTGNRGRTYVSLHYFKGKIVMGPFARVNSRIAGLCLTGLLLIVPPAIAADYSSGVTAKVLQKTSVTGNGQTITYPLTDKAEVTAMTVDLAPGAETGWHQHPVPVYAYVVAGNLSVELEDGRQLSFKSGDAII